MRTKLLPPAILFSLFVSVTAFAQTKSAMPWVTNPAFTTLNRGWDIEKDPMGNINAFGGYNGTQLKHYTPTGSLMWTHNTLYTQMVGDLAVDSLGNSYVTASYPASILKVNTSGVQQYKTTGVPGIAYWAIVTNCTKGKVVVGISDSTKGGYLAYMDPNTGALGTQVKVSNPGQDVRALCSSANGNYYLLTSDFGSNERCIGVDKNFNVLFNVPSLHNPTYMNTPLYSPATQGFNGIAADLQFVYTHSGDSVYKRDMFTGALLARAAVTSGSKDLHSGIYVDACGFVYAGNNFGFVKFNSSLVQNGIFTTGNGTFDISEAVANGEVLSTGNGHVASMQANACGAPVCNGATSGLKELANGKLTVFPNPSKGSFTIRTAAAQEKHIEIYDAQGKLVYGKPASGMETVIELPGIAKGLYFIRVTGISEVITERLVIE